jgi:hypothetical protein
VDWPLTEYSNVPRENTILAAQIRGKVKKQVSDVEIPKEEDFSGSNVADNQGDSEEENNLSEVGTDWDDMKDSVGAEIQMVGM